MKGQWRHCGNVGGFLPPLPVFTANCNLDAGIDFFQGIWHRKSRKLSGFLSLGQFAAGWFVFSQPTDVYVWGFPIDSLLAHELCSVSTSDLNLTVFVWVIFYLSEVRTICLWFPARLIQ